MEMRQQAAIDFIVAYSLALLIISIFIVSVVILSDSRPPISYIGSTCNIQPLLPCSQTLLAYSSKTPLQYYVLFTNQLGPILYFPPNAINISTTNIGVSGVATYLGNCTPSYASEGAPVLCSASIPGTVRPSVGSQTSVSFTLSYNICNSVKSCNQAGIYKSTGYSLQTIAPTNVVLYQVQFITSPNTLYGTIELGGVTYYNGITAYFLPGNYAIFGSSSSGYTFNSWLTTGTSVVGNAVTQSTSIQLNSNTVLTGTFH